MSIIVTVSTQYGPQISRHPDRVGAFDHLRATFDPDGDLEHFTDDDVLDELRTFAGLDITVVDDSVPTADELATHIPAHVAQETVVRALAILGSELEWNSEIWDDVVTTLVRAKRHLGDVPDIGDQDDDALRFWKAVDES